MLTISTEERLALLLNVLGEDAAGVALKSMNPTRANFVSKLLDEYKNEPPNAEEVDFIVEDFMKYFAFAMRSIGPAVEKAGSAGKGGAKGAGQAGRESEKEKEQADGPKIQVVYFDAVEETGDLVQDLNKLDPFQIATVLESDQPLTIATILQLLATPLAAAVVENLPDDKRNEAVIFMSQPSPLPDRVKDQIIRKTFDKANAVNCRKEEVKQSDVMAELMRALPKDMRKELIEKLTEVDKELVEEIRSKLYVFDDVLRLDDRDTQKVLGETETDTLIVALQRVDPEVSGKILGNLSKRARQTIEEEMEYKTGVSDEEIEEARKKLVEAIGKLDEAGEITLN